MIKTKVAFLEGRLLSSPSEQLKKNSKSSDWLEKSRPSKKATFVLIMQTGYISQYFNRFNKAHTEAEYSVESNNTLTYQNVRSLVDHLKVGLATAAYTS